MCKKILVDTLRQGKSEKKKIYILTRYWTNLINPLDVKNLSAQKLCFEVIDQKI